MFATVSRYRNVLASHSMLRFILVANHCRLLPVGVNGDSTEGDADTTPPSPRFNNLNRLYGFFSADLEQRTTPNSSRIALHLPEGVMQSTATALLTPSGSFLLSRPTEKNQSNETQRRQVDLRLSAFSFVSKGVMR